MIEQQPIKKEPTFAEICKAEQKLTESNKSLTNAQRSLIASNEKLIRYQREGKLKDEVFQELHNKTIVLISNIDASRDKVQKKLYYVSIKKAEFYFNNEQEYINILNEELNRNNDQSQIIEPNEIESSLSQSLNIIQSSNQVIEIIDGNSRFKYCLFRIPNNPPEVQNKRRISKKKWDEILTLLHNNISPEDVARRYNIPLSRIHQRAQRV